MTGAATGGKDITGYDYERTLAGSNSFGNAGTATGTQVDIVSLGNNIAFDFRVRARNADREGEWRVLTVSGRPQAPGNDRATASTTSTDVTVTWDTVTAGTPIVSYRVKHFGRAATLYNIISAPMAFPTRSAAASISRSPRWA